MPLYCPGCIGQEVAGRRPALKISAWTPSMTVHRHVKHWADGGMVSVMPSARLSRPVSLSLFACSSCDKGKKLQQLILQSHKPRQQPSPLTQTNIRCDADARTARITKICFYAVSNFVESSFKSSFELLELLLDEIYRLICSTILTGISSYQLDEM